MNTTGALGIIFLHHDFNDVVRNNLRSIKKHNADAKIITMSAGASLPGGYSINATPKIKELHSANQKRGSDWLVCSWFLQHKEKYDKWWVVEWDTYCATSVRDYYRPVWEFPFVASSVRLPCREPEWHWFSKLEKVPQEYIPYMAGGVPFLYLMTDEALKKTCATLLARPLIGGNGELRFTTAANKSGFAPCGFSPPNDKITWIPWRHITGQPAIFHPVKQLTHSGNEYATNRSRKIVKTRRVAGRSPKSRTLLLSSSFKKLKG